MIYLDTSFLAPLFREEISSRKVADFIAKQAAGTLAISKWTGVEFASLVSRDVRMGEVTMRQGQHLVEEFNAVAASSLVIFSPNGYDFDLAGDYVANFSTHLRGPDALHLAVAHNNGVEFIATLDDGMLAAAKKLKIPAKRVIR